MISEISIPMEVRKFLEKTIDFSLEHLTMKFDISVLISILRVALAA